MKRQTTLHTASARLPLAALVAALASGSALAQVALEEVVVTAQKRQEFIQDTPISLVSLGTEQLENFKIRDVTDLSGNVPNLQVSPHTNSATTPRVFIRGVGNFDDQITQDPSVAIYMDGVYIGRNQGMGTEVADIERIEVLRGPQGTLYGRNATGGAINFVTRAPDLGQWGASQELTFGRRSEFRSRTMINLPLGEAVAARAAYLKSDRDGFVKNAGQGPSTYGDQRHAAQRVDLLYQPDGRFELRYGYDRSTMKDSPYYLAPTEAGQSPRRPSRSHAGGQQIKRGDVTTYGHQLTMSWDVQDELTLRSITAYRDLDSYVFQDYLSGTGRSGTPFNIDSWVDQHQYSQELQLVGSALDHRLDYTLGVYWFKEKGDGVTLNNYLAHQVQERLRAKVENRALALFGQATYTPDVLEQRLHLTAGLRWSEDKRRAGLDTNSGQGAGSKRFEQLSPALTLAYDLTDDAHVYAKVTEGYKTGGFNVRASTMAFFEQGFDEETLRSWEAGLKSQWFGNRLRANAAVFQADYKDIQVSTQADYSQPTSADIINAGRATIKGAELELTALLAQGLVASLQYGYLDAGYDRIVNVFGEKVTGDYALVNAPRHSYTLDVSWDVARTPAGLVLANVNYTWQDEKFIRAERRPEAYVIDDYGLLNARLSLEEIPGIPVGELSLSLWGRNLENKSYAFLDAPLLGGFRGWGEPRSYGVDLKWEF